MERVNSILLLFLKHVSLILSFLIVFLFGHSRHHIDVVFFVLTGVAVCFVFDIVQLPMISFRDETAARADFIWSRNSVSLFSLTQKFPVQHQVRLVETQHSKIHQQVFKVFTFGMFPVSLRQ